MQRLARLIALQLLLETRVGLYHLCAHAAAAAGDAPLAAPPRPALADLLAAAQEDLGALTAMGEHCPMAEPAALLYQAVLRHLAGGGARVA
jgi:hypothetical protein